MARRPGSPTYGKRFVGNANNDEVHDLDNEKTGANECQIDEIIDAGHAVTFTPDTLDQAHRQGYDNCAYCIGGSAR
jgi:hypoxanthine-guanine phosphoribosyltransferase